MTDALAIRDGTIERCMVCGSYYVDRKDNPGLDVCPACLDYADAHFGKEQPDGEAY